MNILLIIHHHLDLNSGAPGSTMKIGQQYQELGHQVQFYSFDNLPSHLPEIAKSLVFPEFVAAHLAKTCRKQAIDVIDASSGDAWVWAKLFCQSKLNYPLLVARSHGLEHQVDLDRKEEAARGNLHLSWKYSLYHGGFRLWEVATSFQCADLVFLLNQADWKYTVEQLSVKPEQAYVVCNGIPEDFLNLPFEPMLEAPDAPIGIAQIGTYIPRKGVQYSIPALNKVLVRYRQVKVSLLGTGCSEAPPEEEIYAAFDPEVRDRVCVIPHYSHETLPILLQGHQIKLFTSLSEGMGKALLEAMACGLAPITTPTSGAMEFVRGGHNAHIIPFRDSTAIEQALEQLINDRVYLDQLRHNAYATAQQYSWSRAAKTRLALYKKALDKRKDSL